MQLTRFTDFSLRTLIYLAIQPGDEKVSLQRICDHFNMPRNHLIRVSQRLSQLGYVNSSRGQKGGLTLARKPSEINIGQVVREMENQLEPIPCEDIACPLASRCQLEGILGAARDAFLDELGKYRLSDLTQNGESILHFLRQPAYA
ncbi:MAG: Rrf2 family transcriptional regulator [Gammaproteobacteria bacterium]|nr:Rrf2 family transcriptional regulator [Gammaproteobacteria bacterium]